MVVFGQRALARGELPQDEGINGFFKKRLCLGIWLAQCDGRQGWGQHGLSAMWVGLGEGLHHGVGAQVFQEHKALSGGVLQNLWGFEPGLVHEGGHVHKPSGVLKFWGGIHDDQGGMSGVLAQDPCVAPETRVRRGQAKGIDAQLVLVHEWVEPLEKGVFTR